MAVALGALTALAFGTGDFLGGSASRRSPTTAVLLVAQACALVFGLGYAVAFAGESTGRDFVYGALAGGSNVVALGFLYQGLAAGRMGVVAPLTAVVASCIPVGWALATGERPSAVALVGVACAVAAGALIARTGNGAHDGAGDVLTALPWAALAGTGFGASFILYTETSADSGFWPLLAGRTAAFPLVAAFVLASRNGAAVRGRDRNLALGAGALDVTGTALLLLSVRRGLASLVAPLVALAPAFTVALARVVLREPVGRVQAVGLALALVGLVLIAAG